MQKHNEWLSNKGYVRHLQVLSKINTRKVHSNLNKTSLSRQRVERTTLTNDSKQHKTQQQPFQNILTRSKEGTKMKDQQILWDNFYLGKRIIETPPVISKKKLDEQYKKHKQIVESMATSTSRKAMPTQFRVKKLQQYRENVEQHNEDFALQSTTNRHFIKIQINSSYFNIKDLVFYRERPSLDNIQLLFIYTTKSGKKNQQTSQSFPISDILLKNFYFSISKRLKLNQQAVLLQFRNLKGLNIYSIGYISFPSSLHLTNYTAELFHYGKPIGQVQISTAYCAKGNI